MRNDETSLHADELVLSAQIPDTQLSREITEFTRDTETELLFNHSSRVYLFGSFAGQRRGLLRVDSQLRLERISGLRREESAG